MNHHYVEQDYAKALYRALVEAIDGTIGATLGVEGAGVHWHCSAVRDAHRCKIHCFDNRGVPQYYTSFERDSNEIATGRTSSMSGTIEAIKDWLQGFELTVLYEKYPFIDTSKRALAALCDEVVQQQPCLAAFVRNDFREQSDVLSQLWFKTADRSCRLSFSGANQHYVAYFYWSGCTLFEFQTDDVPFLSTGLKRWLRDGAMPFVMRREFPALEIGELADYYEQGRPFEGECKKSWDDIESFYKDGKHPARDEIVAFIQAIRQRGYDRTLRAGQSMWTFVLSRSRQHGLRHYQASISFDFLRDGLKITCNIGEQRKVNLPRIELSEEVEQILQHLQLQPVD